MDTECVNYIRPYSVHSFIQEFAERMSARCSAGMANVFISCVSCGGGCSVGCVEKDCGALAGFSENEYHSQLKVFSGEVEGSGAQDICHSCELKRALFRVRRSRFGISHFQSMCLYFLKFVKWGNWPK